MNYSKSCGAYLFEPFHFDDGSQVFLRISIFQRENQTVFGEIEKLEMLELIDIERNVFHSRVWIEDLYTTDLINKINVQDVCEFLKLAIVVLREKFC